MRWAQTSRLLAVLVMGAVAATGCGSDEGDSPSEDVAPETETETTTTDEGATPPVDVGPGVIDDDFCHGEPDGTLCNDGNPCTESDRCGLGECRGKPVAAAPACDDGDSCTEGDVCGAGICAGTALDCSASGDPAACVVGVCNPTLGACEAQPAGEDSACEDGDPCTWGERCQVGVCEGGVPTQDGGGCDDGDACTDGDTCQAGQCAGAGITCPESSDACQGAACDPAVGCQMVAVADGSACESADPCIEDESCQQGVCVGQDVCPCANQADGTACDDGDGCTSGDACQAGACVGAFVDCGGLDGACVVGACDPATGGCVAAPTPTGTSCDDGDPCTDSDACHLGTCAGTPKVCEGQSGACTVPACVDGACVVQPATDGLPCNDQDVCTGHDRCQGGACVGGPDRCDVCAEQVGGACDDGDPCTTDTTCQVLSGVTLCVGQEASCEGDSTACARAVCDMTGQCALIPRNTGGLCDDGNTCTTADTCEAGSCVGSALPLCGSAAPTVCEDEVATGQTAVAQPLPANGGANGGTILGFLDPPSETDWYKVAMAAGDTLTVTISAHCASQIQTALEVHDETGSVVASGYGTPAAPWAEVTFTAPADGSWLLAVNGLVTSGSAGYWLAVQVQAAPSCEAVGCACSDAVCVEDVCVPASSAEIEPNDLPGVATLLASELDVSFQVGHLTGEDDVDWYAVDLPAGFPFTLETKAWCQDHVDPHLSLWDASGEVELAADEDDGAAGHALISGFVTPAAGRYLIRVGHQEIASGHYILSLVDAACEATADCGCAAQVCDLSGPFGVCAPANPGAQSSELLPGVPLQVAVDAAFEEVVLQATLLPGEVTITTMAYCELGLDTKVALRGPGGLVQLGEDDDGAADFYSQLTVQVPYAGSYEVVVSGHGAAVGPCLVDLAIGEASSSPGCLDVDGDGVTACAGDCDDLNPHATPGAPEVPCDGWDNDCDAGTPDVPLDGLCVDEEPADSPCCYVQPGTPGCQDVAVEACVCDEAASCCEEEWSAECVSMVTSRGCHVCPGGVGGLQ